MDRVAVDRVVVAAVRAAVVVVAAGPVVVAVEEAVEVATVVPKDPSRLCRFVVVRASSRVDAASAFRLLSLSATRTVESAGGMERRPRFLWLSRKPSRTLTET